MPVFFIDSNVLIAAAKGSIAGNGASRIENVAFDLVENPAGQFASSRFIQLEVLPKAYNHHPDEYEFLSWFFTDRVDVWAADNADLTTTALHIAHEWSLSALDALHIAAMQAVRADEFITAENGQKDCASCQKCVLFPLKQNKKFPASHSRTFE